MLSRHTGAVEMYEYGHTQLMHGFLFGPAQQHWWGLPNHPQAAQPQLPILAIEARIDRSTVCQINRSIGYELTSVMRLPALQLGAWSSLVAYRAACFAAE